MMKYLLLILLFLYPAISTADIYKTVDANGDITFSDKPTSQNSTVISLPKPNTAPATKSEPVNSSTPTATTTEEDKNGKKPYTKFQIASPADQETIQNQPNLAVKIDVEPDLQPDDVIQIYIDGGPVGNAMHATDFNLTIPYRGTHIVSATLFDKDMRVLKKSNAVTIFVHQAHLGTPP